VQAKIGVSVASLRKEDRDFCGCECTESGRVQHLKVVKVERR
jgi:hypothetical protein